MSRAEGGHSKRRKLTDTSKGSVEQVIGADLGPARQEERKRSTRSQQIDEVREAKWRQALSAEKRGEARDRGRVASALT